MPVPLPVMNSHWSDSLATFDRLRVCSNGSNMVWRASKPYCGHWGIGPACAGTGASIVSPATKASAQSLRPPRCMQQVSGSRAPLSIGGTGIQVAKVQLWTLLFLQERQERFVTCIFHSFDWNEMEGGRVNGVDLSGGRFRVGKEMAKVGVTSFSAHLGALHIVRSVQVLD